LPDVGGAAVGGDDHAFRLVVAGAERLERRRRKTERVELAGVVFDQDELIAGGHEGAADRTVQPADEFG